MKKSRPWRYFYTPQGPMTLAEIARQQNISYSTMRYRIARGLIKLKVAPAKPRVTDHPLYWIWNGMRTRCENPRQPMWLYYGGRGIKVCDAWLKFTAFYRDMHKSWRPGLTLERVDNNKGYTPQNCRWVTRKEQMRNTRRTHMIDTPWGRMPLVSAAERSDIHRTTIYSRIKAGTDPFRDRP
jgi:hypothetical protein